MSWKVKNREPKKNKNVPVVSPCLSRRCLLRDHAKFWILKINFHTCLNKQKTNIIRGHIGPN